MEENKKISARTGARALEPIHKLGYTDGASDGQDASFQTSFNTGYEQGFAFGLDLGIQKALGQLQSSPEIELHDPRRINCQMCITGTESRENIVNLYNIQKEKNDDYLTLSLPSPKTKASINIK